MGGASERDSCGAIRRWSARVSAGSLRVWLRRLELDAGVEPAFRVTIAEETSVCAESRVKLRNEVLLAANAYFADRLDRPIELIRSIEEYGALRGRDDFAAT